jgi:8-oxo-dGTP diphosphatase
VTSAQAESGRTDGRGERDDRQPGPKNVTSVGGLVVGASGVLLVKMAYGPTIGKYMLPGGIVEPGETLDAAVVREVLEETGVSARVIGICGVRSRFDGSDNDTYVIFLLEPTDGSPHSDGYENEDARYFTLEELEAEDVTELSRSMGKKALLWNLSLLTFAEDYDWGRAGQSKRTWRLFR